MKFKGVQFQHVNEYDAMEVLEYKNYYFKLNSYKEINFMFVGSVSKDVGLSFRRMISTHQMVGVFLLTKKPRN